MDTVSAVNIFACLPKYPRFVSCLASSTSRDDWFLHAARPRLRGRQIQRCYLLGTHLDWTEGIACWPVMDAAWSLRMKWVDPSQFTSCIIIKLPLVIVYYSRWLLKYGWLLFLLANHNLTQRIGPNIFISNLKLIVSIVLFAKYENKSRSLIWRSCPGWTSCRHPWTRPPTKSIPSPWSWSPRRWGQALSSHMKRSQPASLPRATLQSIKYG